MPRIRFGAGPGKALTSTYTPRAPFAELSLDATRYLGEILAQTEKRDGGDAMRGDSSLVGDEGAIPPRLRDIGITYDQSSKAQRLAAIAEPAWDAFKAGATSDRRHHR